MSYTGRHRHKTRREKLQRSQRNLRVAFIIGIIAIVVLLLKNRVYLYDTMRLWFY
ncbi:MAG: hypothetical protein AAFW73_22340 [Bacteroidota bacterium]